MNQVYKEYFIYSAEWLPLAAGTANASPSSLGFTEFQMRIGTDADFEILKTISVCSDRRVWLNMRDTSGRDYFKGDSDLRLISGGTDLASIPALIIPEYQFRPYVWPGAFRVAGGSTISVKAADFSGVANTIRMSLHGNKVKTGTPFWETKQYRYKVPYTYTLDMGTIAANTSQLGTISIDVDADFHVQMVTGISQGTATIMVTDTRAKDWMDRAVHIYNFFGNGQYPNVLNSGRYLHSGGAITMEVTDLSGAANRVHINIHGLKLYT